MTFETFLMLADDFLDERIQREELEADYEAEEASVAEQRRYPVCAGLYFEPLCQTAEEAAIPF